MLALVAATVAADSNSFAVAFQFDDFPNIVDNPAIRDLAQFARPGSPTGLGAYLLMLIRPRWVGELSFALGRFQVRDTETRSSCRREG